MAPRESSATTKAEMATIFDPTTRAAVHERVSRLRPDARPLWGRMTAPQVVKHLGQALKGGLGEIPVGPPRGPFSKAPLNWVVIHLLPWPKGKAQSPAEFLGAEPADWEADLAELRALIDRTAAKGPRGDWPPSPALGAISGASFGVLTYRHVDHHLRQLGV